MSGVNPGYTTSVSRANLFVVRRKEGSRPITADGGHASRDDSLITSRYRTGVTCVTLIILIKQIKITKGFKCCEYFKSSRFSTVITYIGFSSM